MNATLKYTLIGTGIAALLALAWWKRRAILYPLFKANQFAYFKQLHPKYRPVFEKFVERCEKAGYDIMFTSLYRTAEQQQAVSNYSASYHNLGMAVDINALDSKGKRIVMASSKATWKPIVEIAKDLGLRWGGDFTGYYDSVHFDAGKLVGKSPSELLAMAKEQGTEPNKVHLT
jgi:hypothetical protein